MKKKWRGNDGKGNRRRKMATKKGYDKRAIKQGPRTNGGQRMILKNRR